jgi:hypothetical protein
MFKKLTTALTVSALSALALVSIASASVTCPHNLYHSLCKSDGLFQPYCLRCWRPVSEAIMLKLQLVAIPR